MDFLLMLTAFGTAPSPGSQAAEFDFDENGVIDMYDFLEMLSRQPDLDEQTTSWKS